MIFQYIWEEMIIFNEKKDITVSVILSLWTYIHSFYLSW